MEDPKYVLNLNQYDADPAAVVVRTDWYAHGDGLAVFLVDAIDGAPFATVSVNVEGVQLADDEFVFKTYSENEGLLEIMLLDNFVELTGRSTDLGPICRLLKGSSATPMPPPATIPGQSQDTDLSRPQWLHTETP